MAANESAVAVVGAGGFLGTALTRALTARAVPAALFTRTAPFLTPAGRPVPGLTSARTVVWLATSINPALAESEPWRADADQQAFASMLAGLEEPYPRIVLLSSGGTVYDPKARPPYREDTPTRPAAAYGWAKLALERALLGSPAGQAGGVVVRASNVYGPGQPARSGQGVIAYWLKAAADGDAITMYGDPGSTRDYLYIDDAVDALLAIIVGTAELPAVLNIGSGRATSLQELVKVVCAVVGHDEPVDYRPGRAFDVAHAWLDSEQARRVLGWAPQVDLATGVARAWASVSGRRL